ncbi:hypothetical protein PIB30_000926 [Stylosanthes scabra]|uniref:VQ domain-containing protein n=1 Tax=Stylosanthes scabra TaxID=79078 RepID=A0ABU6S326_9FABA|nr:hypothetical protein [Stylosanthes scabra]
MENKLQKKHHSSTDQNQICIADNPFLAMHSDSKTISKTRKNPKIRIIHMFPPQIIVTEAENFRELVQKITGKPPTTTHHQNCCSDIQKKPTISSSEDYYSRIRSNNINNKNSGVNDDDYNKHESMNKNSSRRETSSSVKKEQEEEAVCGGGYLGVFSDDDLGQSFISELSLLPFDI